MVPYTKIDAKLLDSAEHRAMARKLANEAMVLLKNDGVLPLRSGALKIALVGPLADQTKVLLGNYNGVPSHSVSVLEGLKAEFPSAKITFVPGTQFLRNDGTPVPNALLTTPDGKPGVKADYGTGDLMGGKPTPLMSRVEPGINLSEESIPAEAKGKGPIGVQWTGFLTPNETGDFKLGVLVDGFARVSLDGKEVTTAYSMAGAAPKVGRVHLEKGQKVPISVSYGMFGPIGLRAQLIWQKVNMAPSPEAVAAAKDADVVVAVVGITSELEGEEMQVTEEGFLGGDRTSLNLPKPEEELLQAVSATGKPLVVVLMNGSALSVNWAKEHANAIVDAWYSGEEGGAAVAETLSGKNNPAGRLPVTFYKGVEQLPLFEDYTMKGRTYRYFEGTPLYPFGYGLSYTTFQYTGLTVTDSVQAGDPVSADVTVTNNGSRDGDEVVQLYLTFPDVKGAPLKALRAFQRVHLEAGAAQKVHFELKDRDLSMVTEAGEPIIAEGSYSVHVGGGQPGTDAPGLNAAFKVKGQLALSE